MSLRDACRRVEREILRSPEYAHTSHLRVQVGGAVVYDEHYRGPRVADVFSVTKTVLATVVGIAVRERRLPDLDTPVVRGQTWRHLLTMTRGAAVDGVWDVDAFTALPGGQAATIAAAPQVDPPGTTFRYDNGAAHLLSAAVSAALGEPVSAYAERRLFAPLGITGAVWPADPDGVSWGMAHLRLSAGALARLGEFWRAGGPAMAPAYAAEMRRAQSPGGPPENLPYGFLTWIGDGYLLAGGWAGQHVLVLPGAVVVTTGDPGFDAGPPPSDRLSPGWRPALDLIRRHLLPELA